MNVLVVDDDAAIRALVSRVFKRRGDKVESAKDGDGAIECLKARAFDLVVLDLMMPRTDGFGVLSYLGTLDGHRPQIIVMTAAVPGLADKVPANMVVGVLGKPFDLRDLVALAEKAFPRERPHQLTN
ncbi:MAG: two-component system, OmpR family, alkaline phosphatase synthesis response regulator PhoP [Thermoanaerobaculia bacterium]|jgi:DNA-binding response OmpR family regulator|nr:two-component system, OmpR family, alkaline phosphatase synthesis response regulator PhoP [Thermoanaerobaculia bacterium]